MNEQLFVELYAAMNQQILDGPAAPTGTARFLSAWTWGVEGSKPRFKDLHPDDQAIQELASARPPGPIFAYRSHLQGRPHGPWESWTTDRGLADTITACEPGRVTLERRLHPSEILYHADHLPAHLRDHALEHEVVIAHGPATKRLATIRQEPFERGQLTNGHQPRGPARPTARPDTVIRTEHLKPEQYAQQDSGSPPPPPQHIDWNRVKQLGTTEDYREAGYLSPDGTMIDLSGKREGHPAGQKNLPHWEVAGLKTPTHLLTNADIKAGKDKLNQDMMRRGYNSIVELLDAGHIRHWHGKSIDMRKQPTEAQERHIRNIVDLNHGRIMLDMAEGPSPWNAKKREYDVPPRNQFKKYQLGTHPDQVLEDIRRFYRGQQTAPQSITAQFHSEDYSMASVVSRDLYSALQHACRPDRYTAVQPLADTLPADDTPVASTPPRPNRTPTAMPGLVVQEPDHTRGWKLAEGHTFDEAVVANMRARAQRKGYILDVKPMRFLDGRTRHHMTVYHPKGKRMENPHEFYEGDQGAPARPASTPATQDPPNLWQEAQGVTLDQFLDKHNSTPTGAHYDTETDETLPEPRVHGYIDPRKVVPSEIPFNKTNPANVAQMIKYLRAGGKLPPVEIEGLVDSGDPPSVEDGHHRTAAHLQAGIASMPFRYAPHTLAQIWARVNRQPEHLRAVNALVRGYEDRIRAKYPEQPDQYAARKIPSSPGQQTLFADQPQEPAAAPAAPAPPPPAPTTPEQHIAQHFHEEFRPYPRARLLTKGRDTRLPSAGGLYKWTRKDRSKVGTMYSGPETEGDEVPLRDFAAWAHQSLRREPQGITATTDIFELAPDLQRKGHGQHLWRYLEKQAAAQGANRYRVTHVESSAHGFWKKMGFRPVGESEDSRTWEKELPAPEPPAQRYAAMLHAALTCDRYAAQPASSPGQRELFDTAVPASPPPAPTPDPLEATRQSLDRQGIELSAGPHPTDPGALTLQHLIVRDPARQRQGHGTAAFRQVVEAARQMGKHRIHLEAARDDENPENSMAGYYAFARLGADGPLPRHLARDAKAAGFNATHVQHLIATPEGRAWWRENGDTMDMTFDLSPESPSMRMLAGYRPGTREYYAATGDPDASQQPTTPTDDPPLVHPSKMHLYNPVPPPQPIGKRIWTERHSQTGQLPPEGPLFFSPRGEGLPEYGEQVRHHSILPHAKLFRGASSIHLLDAHGLWSTPQPEVRRLTGRDTLEDADLAWGMNELKPGQGQGYWTARQKMAEDLLRSHGYDGADWSEEDDLSPHQYHIWNRAVVATHGAPPARHTALASTMLREYYAQRFADQVVERYTANQQLQFREQPGDQGVVRVHAYLGPRRVGTMRLMGTTLGDLQVSPPHRRQGIGTAMVQEAIKRGARHAYTGSDEGTSLLHKVGFEHAGEGRMQIPEQYTEQQSRLFDDAGGQPRKEFDETKHQRAGGQFARKFPRVLSKETQPALPGIEMPAQQRIVTRERPVGQAPPRVPTREESIEQAGKFLRSSWEYRRERSKQLRAASLDPKRAKVNPDNIKESLDQLHGHLGETVTPEETLKILNHAGLGQDSFDADVIADELEQAHGPKIPVKSLRSRAWNSMTANDRDYRRRDAVEQAGDARALKFTKPGTAVHFVVHPAAHADHTGQWQITRFDDRGPSGHQYHKTKEEAIGAAIGAHPNSYWNEGDAEYQLTEKYTLVGDDTPFRAWDQWDLYVALWNATLGLDRYAEASDDYRGEHQAPGPDSGAPAHDLTANGIYPEDVYSDHGPRYYGDGSEHDPVSFGIVHQLRAKPAAKVKIYRAVPLGTEDMIAHHEAQKAKILKRGGQPGEYDKHEAAIQRLRQQPAVEPQAINPGDWVTTNLQYAHGHGRSALNGQYKILRKTVPAAHLFTNGDSIHEWGYQPPVEPTRYGLSPHSEATTTSSRPQPVATRPPRAHSRTNAGGGVPSPKVAPDPVVVEPYDQEGSAATLPPPRSAILPPHHQALHRQLLAKGFRRTPHEQEMFQALNRRIDELEDGRPQQYAAQQPAQDPNTHLFFHATDPASARALPQEGIRPEAMNRRDAGFFGPGFYASRAPQNFYGRSLVAIHLRPDARVLEVGDLVPKSPAPWHQDFLDSYKRRILKHRPGMEPARLQEIIDGVTPGHPTFNHLDYKNELGSYARSEGFDASTFANGQETVIHRPEAVAHMQHIGGLKAATAYRAKHDAASEAARKPPEPYVQLGVHAAAGLQTDPRPGPQQYRQQLHDALVERYSAQWADPPLAHEMTEQEFQAAAIPADQAPKIVARIRSGDQRAKNRGQRSPEQATGPLVHTLIPTSLFSKKYIEFLRGSSSPDRVKAYTDQRIQDPIYALPPRERPGGTNVPRHWQVSDGGHRLLAALDRGDRYIPALTEPGAHRHIMEHLQTGRVAGEQHAQDRYQAAPDPYSQFRELVALSAEVERYKAQDSPGQQHLFAKHDVSDEPRDASGEWTSGGSSAPVEKGSDAPPVEIGSDNPPARPAPEPGSNEDLVARFKAGDQRAGNQLIEQNRRFIYGIARRYARNPTDLEDMFQEGAIAMVEMARAFDPERGTKFTTPAQTAIERHLAQVVGKQARRRGVWQQPDEDQEGRVLQEPVAPPTQDPVEASERQQGIRHAIESLPNPRHRLAIKWYFGIEGERKTQEEIAREFGVKKQRVSALLASLLPRIEREVASYYAQQRVNGAFLERYAAQFDPEKHPRGQPENQGEFSASKQNLQAMIQDHDQRGLSNAQRKPEVEAAGLNWQTYKRARYGGTEPRPRANVAPETNDEPEAEAPLTPEATNWRDHVNDALLATSAEDGGVYGPDYPREYRETAHAWQARPTDEQAREIWETAWRDHQENPDDNPTIHDSLKAAAGLFHARDWDREYDERSREAIERADREALEREERQSNPEHIGRHLESQAKEAHQYLASGMADRHERAAAKASVQAHEAHQHLLQRGWTPEYMSDSGSTYYRKGNARFRVADHDVPATEERMHNRQQGGFSWADASNQLILPVHDVASELESIEMADGDQEQVNYTQAFHDAFVERYGFLSTIGAGLQALGQRISPQATTPPAAPASAPNTPAATRPAAKPPAQPAAPKPARPAPRMPHVVDDLTVRYTGTPAIDHAREVLGALHNPELLQKMADPVADRAAKVSSGHAQRGTARYEDEYARHIETARRQVYDDLNKRLPEILDAADAEHEHHQRLNQLASDRHRQLHAEMLRNPEGSQARTYWATRLQESKENILGHRQRLQEAQQEIAGRRDNIPPPSAWVNPRIERQQKIQQDRENEKAERQHQRDHAERVRHLERAGIPVPPGPQDDPVADRRDPGHREAVRKLYRDNLDRIRATRPQGRPSGGPKPASEPAAQPQSSEQWIQHARTAAETATNQDLLDREIKRQTIAEFKRRGTDTKSTNAFARGARLSIKHEVAQRVKDEWTKQAQQTIQAARQWHQDNNQEHGGQLDEIAKSLEPKAAPDEPTVTYRNEKGEIVNARQIGGLKGAVTKKKNAEAKAARQEIVQNPEVEMPADIPAAGDLPPSVKQPGWTPPANLPADHHELLRQFYGIGGQPARPFKNIVADRVRAAKGQDASYIPPEHEMEPMALDTADKIRQGVGHIRSAEMAHAYDMTPEEYDRRAASALSEQISNATAWNKTFDRLYTPERRDAIARGDDETTVLAGQDKTLASMMQSDGHDNVTESNAMPIAMKILEQGRKPVPGPHTDEWHQAAYEQLGPPDAWKDDFDADQQHEITREAKQKGVSPRRIAKEWQDRAQKQNADAPGDDFSDQFTARVTTAVLDRYAHLAAKQHAAIMKEMPAGRPCNPDTARRHPSTFADLYSALFWATITEGQSI